MSDEPANDAPSSPVSLGENPKELEFGCGVAGDRVVIRFNTLVQWFDIAPAQAAQFGKAIIECAYEAAKRKGVKLPKMRLQ